MKSVSSVRCTGELGRPQSISSRDVSSVLCFMYRVESVFDCLHADFQFLQIVCVVLIVACANVLSVHIAKQYCHNLGARVMELGQRESNRAGSYAPLAALFHSIVFADFCVSSVVVSASDDASEGRHVLPSLE